MAQSEYRLSRLLALNLNLILTGLGGVILLGLLIALGLGEVLNHLRKIGLGWFAILGQEILPILANTAGWNYAFAPDQRAVKFWDLLKMRLAGDALNYLVPSATVGGEIWRINSLRRETSATVGAASVTLSKFNQFVGQALFIAAGLLLAAPYAPLRPDLVPWLWVVLAACLVFLGLVFFGLRRGLFARVAACARTWLPARLGAYLPAPHLAELDGYISSYLSGQQAAFWTSIGFFALAWGLGSVEVALIFYFLGLPINAATAVTVETLSVFIDLAMFFMPAKLGTQEGGKVLIFMSLGLPPVAGLSFGLIRRMRELTWAGLGLGCLNFFPESQAPSPATGVASPESPEK
jgi:hypothetical protein